MEAGTEGGPPPAGGRPRHFLRDDDLSPAEQAEVLDLADALKADRFARRPLDGPRAVAVLFGKPSLRTRVSVTVGTAELGGYPPVIDAQATHFGRGETIEDATRIAGQTGGGVEVFGAPKAACDGADVLATDVWVSMGQDDQEAGKLAALGSYGPDDSYRLDEPRLALAAPGCLVPHCLPAHRGTEITAEVIDGPASAVWDEAENRRHAQKALRAWLLEHAR